MLEVILSKVMLERSLEKPSKLETTFDQFQVEIEGDLTMRCNYSCSYCESYDNSSTTQFKHLTEYLDAIDYLKNYFGNKTAKVDILGGEPMLFKDWNLVLNKIHDVGYLPKITTNLSVTERSLNHKLEKLSPKNCIDVSWHMQFADDDKMLKNIDIIKESGHLRSISILGDKRYWNRVLQAYESVKDTKVAEIAFIKDESAGKNAIANKLINYSDDESKIISSSKIKESYFFKTTAEYTDQKKYLTSINDFFTQGITNFKGMNCYVGENRIHIKQNGDVYPSACLLNYPRAKMGNIFKGRIKKPNRPIVCPFNFCGCGPHLRITNTQV